MEFNSWHVPATEFWRNFGRYRGEAQRETVAVVIHNRITGYFVSAHEYEELQRLKALAPTALAVEDLPAATLKALAGCRMDARHDQLNLLMDSGFVVADTRGGSRHPV